MKYSLPKTIVYIALLCALLCGALLFHELYLYALLGSVLSIVTLIIAQVSLSRYLKLMHAEMDAVISDNGTAAARLISSVNVPCMIFHTDGRIIWRNEAMKSIFDGSNVNSLNAASLKKAQAQSTLLEYAGGAYQMINMPVKRSRAARQLTFQYWVDRTEAEHYRRLYEEQRPYVALMYVDNYEELSSDLQFHRSTVLTEVERLISEAAMNMGALYRRYENGRFIMVFEAQQLKEMEKQRFPLLDKVHKLDTGTEQAVSLSIAVGAANRISDADADARHAMELALGRGGDQAVVKSGVNYAFYGGRRQMETSQSRVRARLFAKALRQLLENSTEVFIMGHKQPDMDCIGAALGLVRCAMQAGCRPHIVLDSANPTIQHAIDTIRTASAYAGVLVTPDMARSMIRPSSVLAIVDTQRGKTTIAPGLLQHFNRLVLVDHHRRSADYIDNATLNYLEARASSTSEMITETMQYFHEDIRPTAFECSALLAGITVDTKHFAFNVGARTFEAAAYLRQHGADIGFVKLMFQDDRQTYADRVDTVKAAIMLYPGVAISSCRPEMQNAPLIAAQAADSLVSIRGVEAAFVLAQRGSGVSISGRSLGRINTQVILEELGGGGHLTMAGAQVDDITIEDCMERMKEIILKYMQSLEAEDE